MRLAVLTGLLLAVAVTPAAAQDFDLPDVTYPALPAKAASAAGFTPKGWTVEQEARGDLNGDGVADLAVVLRNRDPRNVIEHDGLGPSPFDSNPRILAVAFGAAGGGYRLALQDHGLIPRPEMPTLSDPFEEGLSVGKGVLRIRLEYFANAGGWTMFNSTFAFRWQNGRFELIGFDRNTVQRNSGETENLSINYSTRKAKIEVGSIETDSVRTRWVTVSSLKLLGLDQIGDGLAFDPLPEQSSAD